MKKYINIEISFFTSHNSPTSEKRINLWNWLNPDKEYLDIINKIRNTSDKKERTRLKGLLPCVTISGIFRKRNKYSLLKHTGLISIDIDGADNPDIKDFEKLKFEIGKLPFVLYCGLSAGGKGVFVIIPIADPIAHLAHFFSLEKMFFDMGINIDSGCKDITRLRYLSYDERPYFNMNAVEYTDKLEKASVKRSPVGKTKQLLANKQPAHCITLKSESRIIDETILLKPQEFDFTNYPIVLETKEDYTKQLLYPYIISVVNMEIDITCDWGDWFVLCRIIARFFGENGRILFHQISQFYEKGDNVYTAEECNVLFDRMLHKRSNCSANRFFEILEKYGLNPQQLIP